MPCLKSHAERFLKRIGVLTTNAGLTKPSFVISLEEQRARDVEAAVGKPGHLNSLSRYEEDEFGKGELQGSVSTAEVNT
jgi:hypothetical protein